MAYNVWTELKFILDNKLIIQFFINTIGPQAEWVSLLELNKGAILIAEIWVGLCFWIHYEYIYIKIQKKYIKYVLGNQ